VTPTKQSKVEINWSTEEEEEEAESENEATVGSV